MKPLLLIKILLVAVNIFVLTGCGKNKSSESAEPTDRTVYIYLIALDGSPHEGKQFGCNDKLVQLEKEVTVDHTALEAAIRKLINMRDENSLFNFVVGPELMLYQVTSADSVADVYLKGNFRILSACDLFRISEQLNETVKQFREYKKVNFYINNQTLENYLTEEKKSF